MTHARYGARYAARYGPPVRLSCALSARPRFGQAIGRADPVARVSELAALAGPSRPRDYEVPRKDLPELAQAIVELSAAKANPRPAPPDAVLELLEEIW